MQSQFERHANALGLKSDASPLSLLFLPFVVVRTEFAPFRKRFAAGFLFDLTGRFFAFRRHDCDNEVKWRVARVRKRIVTDIELALKKR